MDELGFTLAGFAVLGVLHYAVAIVFAVSEYRKWRPTGWIIPLAVVMFVAFSFIFPVVEHIVRPRMRACGVDRRIIRLKLVLAWSVPLLTSVGIKLCELFCNRVTGPLLLSFVRTPVFGAYALGQCEAQCACGGVPGQRCGVIARLCRGPFCNPSFSRQFAGRFFSDRQIAGKGAKTGWSAENIAPTKQIYSPKVAQTGNKSYFCSLKER